MSIYMIKIGKVLLALMVMGAWMWPVVVERAEEGVAAESDERGTIGAGVDYAAMGGEEDHITGSDVTGDVRRGRRELVDSGEDGIGVRQGVDREGGGEGRREEGISNDLVQGDSKAVGQGEEKILLAVPFVSQAPDGNWSQPYQDACEEAAVIMVEAFLSRRELSGGERDGAIVRMVEWQIQQYGSYKDTNSAETARLAKEYFSLSSRVVYQITAEDVKQELRAGRPVIVLVDGRKLDNPYYTAPGPEKHAVVIKGIEADEFITNDPGTKRGEGYRYPVGKLMKAMVDYNGREAGTGGRAMVVIDGLG